MTKIFSRIKTRTKINWKTKHNLKKNNKNLKNATYISKGTET